MGGGGRVFLSVYFFFFVKGAYGNVTEELFVLTLLYCTRLLALAV